jgi:hypothetical protein
MGFGTDWRGSVLKGCALSRLRYAERPGGQKPLQKTRSRPRIDFAS